MACTGRYAEAFDYGIALCVGDNNHLVMGIDDGGGAAVAFLTDTAAFFTRDAVYVGSPLINVTTSNTYGLVTAVTSDTVLQTTQTWSNGDTYKISTLTYAQVGTIETYLDIASGGIHAALAASGACDCAFASWANGYLRQLNVMCAAVMHECPCGRSNLSDAEKQMWLTWCSEQLTSIRNGELELCAGETGSEFPSIGAAPMGWDPWSQAQIINNSIKSNS